MRKVLISACLLGQAVRYDGDDNLLKGRIMDAWVEEGRVVSICPEVAGGLPVPRPPAEIQGGNGTDVLHNQALVLTNEGKDVTAAFRCGAEAALALALEHDITVAVLKARSPSCGNEKIYDGSFQRRQIDGSGVTAALLQENGIKVFNEDQLDAADRFLRHSEHY